MKFKLVNTETSAVLAFGDDNKVVFGGPWGQLQADGKAEWVENTLTLDVAKNKKWEEIKAERNRLEQAGVPYLGKVIDLDTTSVQRIAIAVQAAQAAISANQSFLLDWTCQDNSVLSMSAAQVVGMSVALAQYSNQLHQTARSLREQVEEADTVEELAAINWPE